VARAMPKRDRLLEGENPASMRPQDTWHWISVYREMIAFKDDLLKRVIASLERVSPAAKVDLADDVTLIQSQLDRYSRRMNFWVERQLELEDLVVDADSRTLTYQDNSITLTKREFQLLAVLLNRPDKYFTAEALLVEAWHDARLPEESMRTYISRVRKKLKTLGNGAEVVNKSRKGYALVFDNRQK
jgi:DNA-binding response OmpR family regulator